MCLADGRVLGAVAAELNLIENWIHPSCSLSLLHLSHFDVCDVKNHLLDQQPHEWDTAGGRLRTNLCAALSRLAGRLLQEGRIILPTCWIAFCSKLAFISTVRTCLLLAMLCWPPRAWRTNWADSGAGRPAGGSRTLQETSFLCDSADLSALRKQLGDEGSDDDSGRAADVKPLNNDDMT